MRQSEEGQTMPVMDQPGWKGAVLRFWQRSYAADYLGYVLLQAAYFGVSNVRSYCLLWTYADQIRRASS